MKISKVIFHMKLIPSHPWWEFKNIIESNIVVAKWRRRFLKFNVYFLHYHHKWKGISFMWKMTVEIFIKSLRFEAPWWVRNELSFNKLYRRRKSKDKFVNLLHPTKIVKIRIAFLKFFLFKNQKLQYTISRVLSRLTWLEKFE